MAGRIALEDFGVRLAAVRTDSALAERAEAPVPQAEAPAEPEPGPGPEAGRNASLARIAIALETLASEQADLRDSCVRQAAAALGEAAESLLPALVRSGFAALVADTAKTIAAGGQWPELALSLEAGEASDVTRYLATTAAAHRIRVDARPGTAPGEAEISWDGGGAEIDAASMAATVLTEYRRKLESLAQTGA
jgi:hypothetical protein